MLYVFNIVSLLCIYVSRSLCYLSVYVLILAYLSLHRALIKGNNQISLLHEYKHYK